MWHVYICVWTKIYYKNFKILFLSLLMEYKIKELKCCFTSYLSLLKQILDQSTHFCFIFHLTMSIDFVKILLKNLNPKTWNKSQKYSRFSLLTSIPFSMSLFPFLVKKIKLFIDFKIFVFNSDRNKLNLNTI